MSGGGRRHRFCRREFLQAAVGAATVAGVGSAAAQGRQQWRFDTGGAVFSSPSVLDGTVFVGSQTGTVYAVDTGSGTERWRFETGGAVNSSPLIAATGTASTATVFVGCNDRYLYALDAETGTERWSFETGGRIQASPVIEDGTVFVTSDHDGVYAIDVATGTGQWYLEDSSVMFASPTAVGETVFVRADTLKALDSQEGWVRWQYEINSGTYSSPTVADGVVYVGDRDPRPGGPHSRGNVHAIDARSGERRFRFETDEFVDSSPTVRTEPRGESTARTVFVGGWQADLGDADHSGSVYAIDTQSGEQRFRFETDGRVVSSPTTAGGTVFVGSWDSAVYALDSDRGDLRFRFETGGAVSSSPTVVDGTVFVGSMDGYLYALDAGTPGSSDGSRVRARTLGHHETEAIDTTLVPEGELDSRSRLALGAGALGGLLSGGSLLYRSGDEE